MGDLCGSIHKALGSPAPPMVGGGRGERGPFEDKMMLHEQGLGEE